MSPYPAPAPDEVGQHNAPPPDATPTAKVAAGSLAGAAVAVLVSIVKSFGIELEPELAAGLVVLLSGLAAYYKKSRPGELDQ